jgi:dipeptidase
MKKFILLAMLVVAVPAMACTNFIVTRGASADGSVMVTYAADSHVLYGCLYNYNKPAKPYAKGSMREVREWDTGRYLGEIPQQSETYNTVGNMNEHQLIIAETTFTGRTELKDPAGKMDYGSMIYIALQRCKTAREAILMMVDLANTHGYASSGESFSVADKNEAWIFELIGKGPANKGVVWVARRIPDGYVCAHANQARITQFPKNDPENCMYAPDVITFAREAGYYNGTDDDFSFSDTYAPLEFTAMRGCEARVWAWFRTVADGMDQYVEYAMGHDATRRMPLWVEPNHKISLKELADAMRDHYEGTPMDMTTDIGAGGEQCPYRWRPMEFEVDGKKYVCERATATQQTAFWFVGQARSWLPDVAGGVIWFGVDDAGTSPLTPIYSSSTDVPEALREGNGHLTEYSPTAMFWIMTRVAQFSYLRYNTIGAYVRAQVDAWENTEMKTIHDIDRQIVEMNKTNPREAVKMATQWGVQTGARLFDKWAELDRFTMVKFKDGNNMKQNPDGSFTDNGNNHNIPAMPDQPGYSEKWKRAVVADHGEILQFVTPKGLKE